MQRYACLLMIHFWNVSLAVLKEKVGQTHLVALDGLAVIKRRSGRLIAEDLIDSRE